MSKDTARLESTPQPLGPNDLWHTPGQKLPNYIEQIAHALMRNGMGESQAIATAINAVKRWADGGSAWGNHDTSTTPEVRAASQRALSEWEKLKRTHESS